ncbi:MAG: hypothetical protein IJY96_06935 [Oscillospiraceae bacterium]|nr:hypothetical protein [Oscillospiraceae bacterium]
MKKKLSLCLVAALLCLSLLCACGEKAPEVTPAPTPEPTPEPVTELAAVVSEAELEKLDKEYPALEKLDLSGSSCYAAIEEYIASHPGVEVTYTVDLGGSQQDPTATSLSLTPGDYEPTLLMTNLAYLRSLTGLSLPCTDLSAEMLSELGLAYPGLAIDYTVDILGSEYGPDAAEIALGSLTSADVESAAAKLALLPALESIDLSKSTLSPAEVALIRNAAPTAAMDYSFDFLGRETNTLETDILFDEVEIGDEGEAAVREALDILPEGARVCFDMCGFSNEVMASIRDDYPNHKVVWRVFFGEYFSMLTDEETVRAIFDLYDGTTENLKYCTEVKYMDIGHNTELTEVDFIAYMPKLEICIMSGSPFTNTSVFANCPNLEWLELVYCPNVTDISALEGLPSLKYLNLTFTQVTDVSMLGSDVPLERFFYANPKLTPEQIAAFEELHPDCWCTYEGFEYGHGWRHENAGLSEFSECYLKLREVFRYGENYYNTKNWMPN